MPRWRRSTRDSRRWTCSRRALGGPDGLESYGRSVGPPTPIPTDSWRISSPGKQMREQNERLRTAACGPRTSHSCWVVGRPRESRRRRRRDGVGLVGNNTAALGHDIAEFEHTPQRLDETRTRFRSSCSRRPIPATPSRTSSSMARSTGGSTTWPGRETGHLAGRRRVDAPIPTSSHHGPTERTIRRPTASWVSPALPPDREVMRILERDGGLPSGNCLARRLRMARRSSSSWTGCALRLPVGSAAGSRLPHPAEAVHAAT